MSFEQIAMKYDSHEVATEICQTKENDPNLKQADTKAHPDRPGKLLYLVWDEEYVAEERDEVLEQLFEQRDDDQDSSDDDTPKNSKPGPSKKKKSKKRKVSSSSSKS